MRTAAIAITCLILAGCSHRVPVSADDTGPVVGPDLLLLPDGRPDIGTPEICRQDQVSWTLHDDPHGNYALVTEQVAAVTPVSIAGATATESATAINHTIHGGVAAMVVTRKSTASTPTAEVAQIQQQFFGALASLGSAMVRASGSTGVSAEGHPDVKEVIWDVSTKPIEPGYLRNLLMASALLRPLSALSGLPGAVASASSALMVKMTVALRQGQVVISAGVANRADYDDETTNLAFALDDLSNGTAVAAAGKKTVFECDIRAISGKPSADIVWIVDESGSMNDNRQDIVNNATKFFSKALAAGLDFRMGVAGMKKPAAGVILGKLCSFGSGASSDDGGEDRFLLPTEQELFTDCVKNPPYYEGGSEHGLTNGYWAVKTHLPRALSSPNRIREGAHLAVIFVTDETSQELKEGGGDFFGQPGFLGYQDYKKMNCELTLDKQAKLQTFIKPLLDLYAAHQATVHLIGGGCANLCNAEMSYGYQELVGALGGQMGDVCQYDLNATLQVIINTIAASASPRTLQHVPISSTLTVEANGLSLNRSRTQGWVYNATSNSLTFINVQLSKGAVVVASYRRF